MTYIDENRNLFADSIKEIVSVKEQPVDKETLHVINPTKRQFKSLLENNLNRKVMTFEKLK